MNAATPSAVSVPQPGAGRRAWWPRLAWAAGALLCVVLYALLLWGLDRRALGVAPGAYRTLANVGLNAAVALPWVLLLWGLTRRLFSSLLLVLLLQAAACQASMVKQQVLGTPLILQDFYFLTSFNRASLEVLGSYREDARAFALACVAGLVAVVAAFRIESPVPRRAGAASVTVLARQCMHADAWATALLVAGPGEGLALAQRMGLEALWLLRRGGGLVTLGLGRFGAGGATP